MKIVILQSNYIPWKGYFDLLKSADLFVVYDSVQFTKNDWRNRNQILGKNGPMWLSIPVKTAGHAKQTIYETQVLDGRWSRKHWASIQQNLSSRPFFKDYASEWKNQYEISKILPSLHEINIGFIKMIARQLGIETKIICDSELPLFGGSPTNRLISICQYLGATEYITGPRGLDYIDIDLFAESKVSLSKINYSDYSEYEQGSSTFIHSLSIFDLMSNTGHEANSYLLTKTIKVI